MKLNAKGREKANANKMVRLFFLRNAITGSMCCLAFSIADLMACLRIVPRRTGWMEQCGFLPELEAGHVGSGLAPTV